MDQEQRQEVVKPEDLVHKLRPWWGIAIASLLSLGVTGGVIAIHFAGAVTPAKKEVSYQKADDTWIDREPDHVVHTESSAAPVASATATPPAQAAARPCRSIKPRRKTMFLRPHQILPSSSDGKSTRRRSLPIC